MYRSRLQQAQEKRNIKLAVWLIALAIMLIATMLVWGIPLLIRIAVLIGDLNSSRRPIDKSDLIPPAPPSLSVLYEATNSARQAIYGFTEPGVTVYLTQNKKSIGNVVAKEDGKFIFVDVNLDLGRNEFSAVSMDNAGNNSQPSTPVAIVYSTKQPKLDIESPTDGQIVTGKENSVEIKGVTDQGARVMVNERIVVVNADGKFISRITLSEGENVLVFTATDRAGNSIRKEFKVSYQK